MAKTIRERVPEDLANLVEKLDYEQNSMRTLLIDAASRGIGSTDAFERWEEKYKEAFAAFQIAKAQIERDYVLPRIGNGKCSWTLSYSTCELIMELEELNEQQG